MTAIVLTMRAPGWVRRVADVAVQITGDTSGLPSYADAELYDLSTITDEVDVLSVDRSDFASIRVRFALRADESGAVLEALSQYLSAAVADVDIYDPATDWDTRRRCISMGIVSGLKLDDEGMVVEASVEASNPAAGQSIGDADRTMGDRYPTVGFPSLAGKQWPVLVGVGHAIPGYKLGLVTGSYPGLGLTGHHIADTSQVPVFYIDGVAHTPTGPISIVNTTDADGFPLAYILGDTTDFFYTAGSFSVDLPGGGVGTGGAAIKGGEVVRWILAASGVAIDWARCASALAALDSYQITLYLDSEVGALDVLRQRVLKQLPIIEETGPAGLWLRLADWRSQPVVSHLEEGASLMGFTGPLTQETDPDDIRNRLTANYAYSAASQDYASFAVVDRQSHPGCATSHTLYGERADETIDLDMVWDTATASRILAIRADRLALPRFTRAAILDASMDTLSAGDLVTITAASAGWTRRKCLIRRIELTSAGDIPAIIEPLPR